jgi:threonine/homoserine/homoserine lactone efflux protein
MLGALIVGLVVGFVLAIPPGPIGIAVVKHAVEGKFRAGGELAAGASTMDGVYALAAAFASSTIMSALGDAVTKNKTASLVFQIVCVAVLVAMAARYLRASPSAGPESERLEAVERAHEERARRLGLARPFFLGVLIALTNLASPTFLPSLVFLSGYLGTAGWLDAGAAPRFVFALGFGTGTLAWFLVLLRFLHGMREKLTTKVTAGMNRFAGGAFIVFAIVLAFRVVASQGWIGSR